MVEHNAIEIGISSIIIMLYLQPSKIKLARVGELLMVKLWLRKTINGYMVIMTITITNHYW